MYFAFLYLLVFAFDILVVTRFHVLGMIPMSYLVSGVGCFFLYFLLRKKQFFPVHFKYSLFIYIYILYVFIMFVSNFIIGNYRILVFASILNNSNEFLSDMTTYSRQLLFFLSLILILMIIHMILSKKAPSFWIIISTGVYPLYYIIGDFFIYGEVCIPVKTPSLIYRYSGIFDLIVLFGWLMVMRIMLDKEYGFES